MDTKHKAGEASRGKIFLWKNITNKELISTIRFNTDDINPIQSGWHFSWLGDKEMAEKLNAVSESPAIKSYHGIYNMSQFVQNKKYFTTGEIMKIVPIDDSFPKFITDNYDYFYKKNLIL